MGPEPDAPRACIKKSDETAAWVVHHSGTETGHKVKDCFGCEGWEAQTYRSDYLAISTPLLKSSVEVREGHSVLLHLLPHSCFTDCLRQPRGMRCGGVQGDQVSVSTRGHCPSGPGSWAAAWGVCTVGESGLRAGLKRRQKQIHHSSRVWMFEC